MSTIAVSFAPTPASRPQSVLLPCRTVAYDVRGLAGKDYVACNSAPSASYVHRGTGWTRVTVCRREEAALLSCFNDGRYEYQKVRTLEEL